MRQVLILVCALFMLPTTSLLAQAGADLEAERQAVMDVIRTAYIEGIHNERDADKARSGFHPEFNMLSLRNGEIARTTIQQWIEGIQRSLEGNPDPPAVPVRPEFTVVQVAGYAAIAQIDVFRGDTQIYTDFMSLYKFEDGWKIVAKIFYSHPR